MRAARTGLLVSVALAVLECEAQACKCERPLVGAGRFYVGAGGLLPPDAPGFPWVGPESLVGATDRVKVVRIDGERRLPVKVSIRRMAGIDVIAPAKKFAPGQVYEVTVRESAAASEARKHMTARGSLPPAELTTRVTIAATPLRLTQATLHAGPQTQDVVAAAVTRGSCREEFGAVKVPLRVELPPEVEPLRDYLVYWTRIDGQTWDARSHLCDVIDPGRSWAGEAGTDLVFAVCDGSPLRERYPLPGPHRVEMLVTTVDETQVITTPALVVEFTCAPPETPPPQPAEEPPAPVEPAKPPEPPALRSRGCTVGEPGFAWVLGAVGWVTRRRRGREPAR